VVGERGPPELFGRPRLQRPAPLGATRRAARGGDRRGRAASGSCPGWSIDPAVEGFVVAWSWGAAASASAAPDV